MQSDVWTFVTLTWEKEKGLYLYINGSEPVSTIHTTSINAREQIAYDTSNHITIGRSNAGDYENTFAEVTSGIFVLFDMYVTRNDALSLYVFYWGHTTTISTDRFININVENNAGVDAILYPDKGEHFQKGYDIKAKMILELRLIEQGMQTDFPVKFRARTKEGNKPLPIDGEETFVATPSEKQTDVMVVKLTQRCKLFFYLSRSFFT